MWKYHAHVSDRLPGVLLSAINEKWLMSFFCAVVLGESKSKLVSEWYQIAMPQPVQSHYIKLYWNQCCLVSVKLWLIISWYDRRDDKFKGGHTFSLLCFCKTSNVATHSYSVTCHYFFIHIVRRWIQPFSPLAPPTDSSVNQYSISMPTFWNLSFCTHIHSPQMLDSLCWTNCPSSCWKWYCVLLTLAVVVKLIQV